MFNFTKYKAIRKQQKVTRSHVAVRLGVTEVAIYNWETGRRTPTQETVLKLARVLDIDAEDVYEQNLQEQQEQEEQEREINNLSYFAQDWLGYSNKNGKKQRNEYLTAIKTFKRLSEDINRTTIVIQALLKSTHSAAYIKDINNKYITANPAFFKLTKLVKNEYVTGKKDSDFFPQQEAEDNANEDKNLIRTGKEIKEDKRFIPGSQKNQFGNVSKVPVSDQNGRIIGLVCVFTDMTLETTLTTQKHILLECIANVSYVMWWGEAKAYDLNNSFKCKHINKNIEELFGIENANDFTPLQTEKFIIKKDLEKYKSFVRSKTYPKHLDYRINHPQKGTCWISSYVDKLIFNEKIIIFGAFKDSKEKMRKIEELEKLTTIVSNSNRAIIIICDGKITYSNDSAKRLYEATEEDINTPLFWWHSILDEDKDGANDPIAMLSDAINNNEKSIKFQYRIKTKKGKIRYVKQTMYKTVIEEEICWCSELEDETKERELENKLSIILKTLETSSDAIWVTKVDENNKQNFVYMNNELPKLYNVTEDELKDNPLLWRTLVDKKHLNNMESVLDKNRKGKLIECYLNLKNGTRKKVTESLCEMEIDGVKYYGGISRDINK
jgi:PAS domain-containing protein